MTTIFLSYSRGDDEPFVKRLHEDLSQRGFDVWFDRVSMPSRQLKFLQEIRDAIAARERLLLVIGPKARTSEYVTQEWMNALEMGKCVNPIVRLNGYRDDGDTVDGYDLMPEELKLIHAEDFRDDLRYAEHLTNLTRQLSDPAPRLGKLVAVPTLPLHYLAQRDRLLELRDALLVDLQRPVVVIGAAARVGVQGMGGIGKSVLAAALARDLEVRRAFPDGIFWIGVGQQPNLVELQRFIARELGDEALFNDLHAGKQKLKELLAERAALLILDDVWQSTDANAIDVLGPRCKLLLTTRDAGLVSTMAGTGYQVQLPTEAEAQALLANAARVPVESLPPLASEIAAECGRLPLALALCGGMASKGHLWERILRALREARLELIADRHEIEEHHRSIWRAMEVSVQVLPPDEQRRFAELAVFATDAAIPEAAVLTLWSHTGGLDELAAADLLVAFNERSLVQLDRSADAAGSVRVRVSLHDLLHDFAARLAAQLFGNLAALHSQLLDAYRKQCPNGWATGPNDGYFFQHLLDHQVQGGIWDEHVEALSDDAFITTCMRLLGPRFYVEKFEEFAKKAEEDSLLSPFIRKLCMKLPINDYTRPLCRYLADVLAKDPGAAADLLLAVSDQSSDSERAVIALRALSGPTGVNAPEFIAKQQAVLPALFSLLESRDKHVRWETLYTYWKLAPKGNYQPLLRVALSEHEHPLVRTEAARQLGETNCEDILPHLQRLADTDLYPLSSMAAASARLIKQKLGLATLEQDDLRPAMDIPSDLFSVLEEIGGEPIEADLAQVRTKPLLIHLISPDVLSLESRWEEVRIVEIILRRLPCHLVCSEGGSGACDLTPAIKAFEQIVGPAAIPAFRRTAYRRFNDLKMGPVEYLQLTSPFEFSIWGIDDLPALAQAINRKWKGEEGREFAASSSRAAAMLGNTLEQIRSTSSKVTILITQRLPAYEISRLVKDEAVTYVRVFQPSPTGDLFRMDIDYVHSI